VIEALSVVRRTPDITVRQLKMTFNQSVSHPYSLLVAVAVVVVVLVVGGMAHWISRLSLAGVLSLTCT